MSSDSRKIAAGELFIPLKGPHFDGHEFIAEALKRGASGSLLEPEHETLDVRFPDRFLIRVKDTLQALGDLAHFWRKRHAIPIAAITGSNGKTTTKEMASRVFAKRFRVLKNEGNLNNRIGLPLSLLKLSAEHEVAVLEMGMNAPGEIRQLKAIADPQVSLITNIGQAHLEFLGTLEGVARAKGELWEVLGKEDWIAVNADDEWVMKLADSARCRKRTFGMINPAEIQGTDIRLVAEKGTGFRLLTANQKREVNLSVFGRHNVYNALAAAALGSILGLDLDEIASGLEEFEPVYGRGKPILLPGDIHLLDDSYNSNPDSLKATLSAFAEMKGNRRGIAVLGDMLEIGAIAKEAHEQAGRWVGGNHFAHLFVLGNAGLHVANGARESGMPAQKIHRAEDSGELLEAVAKALREGDWILIKGSRRMQMERIVEGLKKRFEKV